MLILDYYIYNKIYYICLEKKNTIIKNKKEMIVLKF